MTQRL